MDHNRLKLERAFHDGQAAERALTFRMEPGLLCFENDSYLDHESWVRPALAELGTLADRDILDFGCGHGMMGVTLARLGARVTGFDLSSGYIREARARAITNGACVHFLAADAERLPFGDASFHGIWGNAILHHLDLSRAASEIRRVLRPGGRAVFCEPWGENPVLAWARTRLTAANKRTPTEKPLRNAELRVLRKTFPDVRLRGFQVFGIGARTWPGMSWSRCLEDFDRYVLGRLPGLQRLSRYMVITLIG
jgi:2-polyprenyl-3-methyl-5-hydroxy-6-metoxy-1,4-benzoquinol methylase